MSKVLTENSSDFFSMSRFGLLIRSHVISHYRSWLTTSAALAGVIIFTSLFADSDRLSFYNTWFSVVVIFGGILFSSKAFHELYDKTRNESFLLVPASSFEKTTARLFITTFAYIAYALAFVFLVSILAEFFKSLFFGARLPIFNPFSEQAWRPIKAYLFVQPFYFLGASWFKRNHAVKTTLSLFVMLIGFAIFTAFIGKILFGSYSGLSINISSDVLFNRVSSPIELIFHLIVFGLPLVLWTIAWMRVKEAQASDGI